MRVVSLFSGAGGLDWGFLKAGHEIVWANDNYSDAVATYKRNIGDHIVYGDIDSISLEEIPEHDILIGGFPCQGFSVANTKRKADDKRNKLYLHLLRVIAGKKPPFFLAENVKGLLSLDKGNVLQMILKDFKSAGYRVSHKVLNAADYGVPQTRERVIFIGIRKDLKYEIDFPEPTHAPPHLASLYGLEKWVSIGKAMEEIPEPEESPDIPNHTYSKYKLRFNGHLGHRKIDPQKPSPTVTARGDDRGGVVVLHHPQNHRRMSARELAITQSFPMDYIFEGSQSSVYRQVANAVPPLMAYALAKVFLVKINLPG